MGMIKRGKKGWETLFERRQRWRKSRQIKKRNKMKEGKNEERMEDKKTGNKWDTRRKRKHLYKGIKMEE